MPPKEAPPRRLSGVFANTVSAPKAVQQRYDIMSTVRIGVVTTLLIIVILALVDVIPVADTLTDKVVDEFRDYGVGGIFLYMLLAATFAVICMPSSLLALSAGYIWESTWKGFLAAHPGILAGAMISFAMGRELFKDWLETELRGVMKFDALSNASKEHGYKIVLFGRVSPIPFGLINYALSVSKITYLQFFAASFVGLIPISVGYAKVGAEFYSYFETQEVRVAYDKCTDALVNCCSQPQFNTTCGALSSIVDGSPFATCLGTAPNDCSFSVLKKEAEDMNCLYNDCELDGKIAKGDQCALAEMMNEANLADKGDHATCLRDLNSGMLWPKIVLPIALVLTLVVMGFFGKRALDRGGYLQVQYNLERQKELLLMEREAEEKAASADHV